MIGMKMISNETVFVVGTVIHKHAQEQVQYYPWKGGIARQA